MGFQPRLFRLTVRLSAEERAALEAAAERSDTRLATFLRNKAVEEANAKRRDSTE